MAKKKSRASRKKNRKGAAGKASSAVCGDHKYEVSVYLRHLQNKVNLTERERKLLRMYEYAEASNMSEVVLFKDEKSLVEAREEIHSWNEADNLYFKDPRMWLFTIHDMREDEQIFDKVFQGPVLHKWLKQTQTRLETMVKSAITSERIHGVVIEGLVLHVAKVFMMDLQEKKNETADESTTIKSYCKLLACLANEAKYTKSASRMTGYALCLPMVFTFFNIGDSISVEVRYETIFRSGILEQVLQNITIPWAYHDMEENMVKTFFRRLCCPSINTHKTFKQGSLCHNALLDILQGRVHPCKENKFAIADLYALGRFIELRYFKPTDAHFPNQPIETFRRTCTRCRTMDHSKQMLVCARCKFVSYCSKECQIGDWKDHKADCNKFQKDDYKIVKKFTRNFFIKHQYLITERVKAASLEYSLETVEMVMCLDFRGSENGAPALQNLPNFCFLPKKCFLNRIEEQHSDLYNADNIKRFIDSMISKLGNNFVIVSVSFYSKHCIGVVHFQSNTYGEIWFLN